MITSKTSRPHRQKKNHFHIIGLILLAILGGIAGIAITTLLNHFSTPDVPPSSEHSSEKKSSTTKNLQPIVDKWLEEVGLDPEGLPDHGAGLTASRTVKNAGIVIYDLSQQKNLAEFNQNLTFPTASLYKLFVAYEGYRRTEQGLDDPNEKYVAGHTRAECLDLMIRESDSACAETMWIEIGKKKLDKIIEKEWGITDSKISSLLSTPADIAKMLSIYANHSDLSEKTWGKIQDSMLNQPTTTYDWRRGLPAGFYTLDVYNKVGWEHSGTGNVWNLYHDAAIVENYIIVVMTTRITYQEIAKLGQAIEEAIK